MANAVQLGKAYVAIGARNDPLYKALGQAEKRFERFGAKVGAIAGSFARIGTVIAAPFVVASRTGLEFEKKMAEVQAVTNSTAKDFTALEDTARRLGATTSFTASEVADAMGQLGRAGFKANEIIAAIPTTLQLARASGLGMGEVAEIMADTARAFGIAATDITRVADAITYTANNATTNIQQMGEAIKFVAPSARAAGQGLETITGALGVMANQAVKGSEAGTALSTVLLKLTDVQVQDTLDDLGISIKDTSGNMRNLQAIMGDLGKRLNEVSQVERLSILFQLFDKRGLRAAQILTTMNQEWANFTAATQAAAGTTARTADIMEGKFNRALNEALSAFESLQITISKAVQPTFTSWLKTLTGVFNAIEGFISENKELVVIVAEVGAACLATAAAFGAMAIAAKAAAFSMGAGQGLAGALKIATTAMAAFNVEAQIASVTSASSLIPSLQGMKAALASIGTTSIASALSILKFKAAVYAGIILPFAAAAAIVGSTIAIFYKLYRLWEDNSALIETQNSIDELTLRIKSANDEIGKMNKEQGLGFDFTEKAAAAEVTDRIKAMKEAGKTEQEINEQLKADVQSLTEVTKYAYDERNAYSENNYLAELAQNKRLLQATQEALDANKAATIKSEREKQQEALAIRLDLLQKTKTLQEQFESDQLARTKRIATDAERGAFEAMLGQDPGKVAKMLQERYGKAVLDLEAKRKLANDALIRAREAPTRENVAAAEASLAAFAKERDGLDRLTEYRKQAAQELARSAQEEKQRAEERLSTLSELKGRIESSMMSNRFVEGAKSQFSELTDSARQFLLDTLAAIDELRDQLAQGLISPGDFQRQMKDLEAGVSEALAARKTKAQAQIDIGTTGTFSAREAAGRFGKSAITIATEQLKTLKELLKVTKKQTTSTTYGA